MRIHAPIQGVRGIVQEIQGRKFHDTRVSVGQFFGGQEPGSDSEIKSFCQTNFGVTFDMFSKISVKGRDQHPLYRFITAKETNPEFHGDVRWNFQKYLVDRNGKIIGRFASSVTPESRS